VPCIHTIIDMQGQAPSQAALQGSSQGQHPAALSQQAHASGSANVVAEPASVATVEPASMATEPAFTQAAEPPHPSIADPALPGADLTGDGAAEPACIAAGSAAEEEAKEATGLTPIMDRMVETTVRQGRPLCIETWLDDFVGGVSLQPCATPVRLTGTLPLKLASISKAAFDKLVVDSARYASMSDVNSDASGQGHSRCAHVDGLSGLRVVQGVSSYS